MAFLKKIFNPVDTEDEINEEIEDTYPAGPNLKTTAPANYAHTPSNNYGANYAALSSNQQSQAFIRQAASAGSEIVMVECRDLSSAQNIAVAFKRNATVICDLTNMNSVDYQRALDFVSGVAFVLNGSFIKISREIYILLPQNVNYRQESRNEQAMQQ